MHLAVAYASDSITIVDMDGRIIFANAASARIYGYAEDELEGLEVFQLHPATDRPTLAREIFETTLASGAWTGEITALRKNGETFQVRLSTAQIWDDRGQPTGMVGISTDITEWRKAEEELRRSQEQYANIFEHSNDAIFVIDPSADEILDVNSKACSMLGYSKQELLSMPVSSVHPNDMPMVREFAQSVTEQGHGWTDEFQCITKQGTVVDAEVSASTVDIPGRSAIIFSVRDITERKQLQQQLVHAEKLASIGTLVSGVAHEINNPLTVVRLLTELMLQQDLTLEMQRDLQVVHQQANRAVEIVQNFLSFARRNPPERGYISVNDVVNQALSLRTFGLRVNNMELEIDLQPDLPLTIGDAKQLQQVFMNLILNAEQAMAQAHGHRTLRVTTQQIGEGINIVFTDDGPGIPPENLSRIFDPFFTTKKSWEGTGLGLSICYGIIQAHNGQITVNSEEGHGATFTVEIPLIKDAPSAETDRPTTGPNA